MDTGLSPGDRLLALVERAGAEPDTALVQVRKVTPDADAGHTVVDLEPPPYRSDALVGVGCRFGSELRLGWQLEVAGQLRVVSALVSDLQLAVDVPFAPPIPLAEAAYLPGAGTVSSVAPAPENPDLTVSGSGTRFFEQLGAIGSGGVPWRELVAEDGQRRWVTAVWSDSQLRVDRPFDPPLAGSGFKVRLSGFTASSPAAPPESPLLYVNRGSRLRGIGARFLRELRAGSQLQVAGKLLTVTAVGGDGAATLAAPVQPPIFPGEGAALVGIGSLTTVPVDPASPLPPDPTVLGSGTQFLAQVGGDVGQPGVPERVILAGSQRRLVQSVASNGLLTVDRPFDPPLVNAPFHVLLTGTVSTLAEPVAGDPVRVFALRQTASFFGHSAPLYASLPDPKQPAVAATVQGNAYPQDWDGPAGQTGWPIWKDPLTGSGSSQPPQAASSWSDADVYLDGSFDGLLPDTWVVLTSSRGGAAHVYRLRGATDTALAGFAINGRATGLRLELPAGGRPSQSDQDRPPELKVRDTVAYLRSEELVLTEQPITATVPPAAPGAMAT